MVGDIMVVGEGDIFEEAIENHDKRLHTMLTRCEERNIVLNIDEKFCLPDQQLRFLVHLFTDEGLKADPDKKSVICDMPVPKDVAEVR